MFSCPASIRWIGFVSKPNMSRNIVVWRSEQPGGSSATFTLVARFAAFTRSRCQKCSSSSSGARPDPNCWKPDCAILRRHLFYLRIFYFLLQKNNSKCMFIFWRIGLKWIVHRRTFNGELNESLVLILLSHWRPALIENKKKKTHKRSPCFPRDIRVNFPSWYLGVIYFALRLLLSVL